MTANTIKLTYKFKTKEINEAILDLADLIEDDYTVVSISKDTANCHCNFEDPVAITVELRRNR